MSTFDLSVHNPSDSFGAISKCPSQECLAFKAITSEDGSDTATTTATTVVFADAAESNMSTTRLVSREPARGKRGNLLAEHEILDPHKSRWNLNAGLVFDNDEETPTLYQAPIATIRSSSVPIVRPYLPEDLVLPTPRVINSSTKRRRSALGRVVSKLFH